MTTGGGDEGVYTSASPSIAGTPARPKGRFCVSRVCFSQTVAVQRGANRAAHRASPPKKLSRVESR